MVGFSQDMICGMMAGNPDGSLGPIRARIRMMQGVSRPSDSVHRHSLTQGEGRECKAVVEADVKNFVAFVYGLSLAKQSSPTAAAL